jgi:hypothetical protein
LVEEVLRHLNGVDNYAIGAHRNKNSQITVAFQSGSLVFKTFGFNIMQSPSFASSPLGAGRGRGQPRARVPGACQQDRVPVTLPPCRARLLRRVRCRPGPPRRRFHRELLCWFCRSPPSDHLSPLRRNPAHAKSADHRPYRLRGIPTAPATATAHKVRVTLLFASFGLFAPPNVTSARSVRSGAR